MQIDDFEEIITNTKRIVLIAIKQHLNKELYEFIDDVMQETYLRSYKKLINNKDSDIKSIENYLYVVAKHESIRMNKKEKKYIDLLNEQKYHLNDSQDIFNEIINIIMSLPEKYKQVAKLFYVNKLSLIEFNKSGF